jgi:hypothetical protein
MHWDVHVYWSAQVREKKVKNDVEKMQYKHFQQHLDGRRETVLP